MVDTYHYISAQIYGIYNTKSEPKCKPWTLGDNGYVNVNSLTVTNVPLWWAMLIIGGVCACMGVVGIQENRDPLYFLFNFLL